MNLFFNITVLKRKSNIVNFFNAKQFHYIVEDKKSESCLLEWTFDDFTRSKIVEKTIVTYKKNNKYIVLFSSDPNIVLDGEEVFLEIENETFSLYHNFIDNELVSVEFKFLENQISHNGTSFVFHKHDLKNYKYIKSALDFGSEASQLIQINNESLQNTLNPTVMQDLLNTFFLDDKFNFNEYVQSSSENDNNSNKYLRSIFFYQTNNAEKDTGKFPTDSFFKFLTKESEIRNLFTDQNHNYKILPNLKLGYITSNQYNITFEDNENWDGEKFIVNAKKIILSNFIEALIRLNKESDKKLLVNFTLLYPNVYNQKTINKIYDELNDIFDDKLKSSKIYGFELNLISESDAAFFGIKSKYNKLVKPKNDYVVIDSGKGTTDYSVIKKHSIDQFETKFRTGFVGAGNLITFSFLIALIFDISKEKDLEFSYVASKLLKNLTFSDFFKMSNKLNDFKINYNAKKENNIYTSLDLESVSIINILDSINTISDHGNYIDVSINYIVNRIVKDIDPFLNTNTTIFLTGRSFKFKSFLENLKTTLYGKCDNVTFISEVPKTISLLGAFSNNLNSSITLEGIPRELDSDFFEKNKNTIEKTNLISKYFSEKLKKYFENDDEIVDENESFLTNGLIIDISKNPKIMCSNSIFDLPSEIINSYNKTLNKKAIIKFDGIKYVVVYNNVVYELKENYTLFTENEMSVNKFSIFPFVIESEFIEYVINFERFLKENYIKNAKNSDWKEDFDLDIL